MKRNPAGSPGEAWRLRLLALLDEARRQLVDPGMRLPERLHAFRKSSKEGRALLKLAPDHLRDDARRLRQTMRELRRCFGEARDARVDLELFVERCGRSESEALRIAGEKIAAVCAEREESAPLLIADVLRRLDETADAVGRWKILPDDGAQIIDRAVQSYKQARAQAPSGEFSLEDLHSFRSVAVDHRYQLCLLAETGGGTLEHRAKAVQDLRQDIGDFLDVERLVELLLTLDVPERDVKFLRKGQRARLEQALADVALLFDPKPRALRNDLRECWRARA